MSVSSEPAHGYAILTALERLPGPRLFRGAGSLYAALDRLADGGLISERADRTDARRRGVFTLTPLGKRELTAELRRMAALVADRRAQRLLAGER
jgi:DNA-binding PadR family transcriptional regulator